MMFAPHCQSPLLRVPDGKGIDKASTHKKDTLPCIITNNDIRIYFITIRVPWSLFCLYFCETA